MLFSCKKVIFGGKVDRYIYKPQFVKSNFPFCNQYNFGGLTDSKRLIHFLLRALKAKQVFEFSVSSSLSDNTNSNKST